MTVEEFDDARQLAGEKQRVYSKIQAALKSESSQVKELEVAFSNAAVSYSSGDSLAQLEHFLDQVNSDLTDSSGIQNTSSPGTFKSVELGLNLSGFGEQSSGFLGGGGEFSISLDENGKGYYNMGLFGGGGAVAGMPNIADNSAARLTGAFQKPARAANKMPWEVSLGVTLIGSGTANGEQLGRGYSVESNTTVAVDFSKRVMGLKGASLDLVTGSTLNSETFNPEYVYIGLGVNAVFANNSTDTEVSIAEGVMGEFADNPSDFLNLDEIGWQESTKKQVFSTLSSTLTLGASVYNLSANMLGHPYGGFSKPLTVHQYSVKDRLSQEYINDKGVPSKFDDWLRSRYLINNK